MITTAQLIDGYTQMVTDHINEGWDSYLLTFMFNQIGGSPRRVGSVMEKEVERVYATLATRIVRKPRSLKNIGKLPVWISCPDFPIPKHDRQTKDEVTINDGQHFHAVSMLPPVSRLREGLDDHLYEEQGRYTRDPLFRIHSEKIDRNPGRVVRYVLKSLERGLIGSDQVLVLPRSITEL